MTSQPLKTSLNPEEIVAMLNAATCLRDRLIISFYSDTGCRVSELLRLKVRDVDLNTRTVLIPHLKRGLRKHCPKCQHSAGRSQQYCAKCGASLLGVTAEGIIDRSRLISIGEETTELLREYTNGMKPEESLIGLSRQRVNTIVRDLARTIGLDGKVLLNPETRRQHYIHPHIFRASLAVDWLEQAGDDVSMQRALQEHLGHQSFNTTVGYHKLAPSRVRQIGDTIRKKRFGK